MEALLERRVQFAGCDLNRLRSMAKPQNPVHRGRGECADAGAGAGVEEPHVAGVDTKHRCHQSRYRCWREELPELRPPIRVQLLGKLQAQGVDEPERVTSMGPNHEQRSRCFAAASCFAQVDRWSRARLEEGQLESV